MRRKKRKKRRRRNKQLTWSLEEDLPQSGKKMPFSWAGSLNLYKFACEKTFTLCN